MRKLLLILMLGASLLAQAAFDVRQFDTPEQEARYKDLIEELRCTVCQNQNIAESNAELAQDLRRKTYQMIQEGHSDREILDYMVERYGNFVLYRPPLSPGTALLWIGPFLIFALGGYMLSRVIRSRRYRDTDNTGIREEQLQRAEALLRDEGNKQ